MLRQVSGARPSYYVYPFGMMSTTGRASQMALMVKNLQVSAGDVKRHGFDPWIRKIHWRRTCRPLDESDRGAWWDMVHRVTKSRTQRKQLSTHIHQDRQIHGKQMGSRGGTEEILLNSYRTSFGSDENVLELGSGEGYTTI